MKTIFLAAVATAMLTSAAVAYTGQPTAQSQTGVTYRFMSTIPMNHTGSQAYPSTSGEGAGGVIVHPPQFNRALIDQPDVGSQQMPPGLR
jgi:hypothetical protein